MKIALLHLSDIHIRGKDDPVLSRANAITATLNSLFPEIAAVILVVTGDIAYQGEATEYTAASNFINEILRGIESKFHGVVKVAMVPGNHDGKFKKSSSARNVMIGSVLAKGSDDLDESIINICTEPQLDYFEFESRLIDSSDLVYADRLWKEIRLNINGKKVAISCINASWLSAVPEQPGKLMFPVARYMHVVQEACDLRIALMHHPLNWYAQTTYHTFRDLCRSRYQIVMSGHEHTGAISSIDDKKNGRSITIEAGALAPHEPEAESEFTVVQLDLAQQRLAELSFVWDGGAYTCKNGLMVWDSFVEIPQKHTENFEPTPEFKSSIEDVGASFTHPSVERVRLSHLFVYPYLQSMDDDFETPEALSAEILVSELHNMGRVLIRAEEQFGKTSLLRHVFKQHLEIGFVPLLVNGKEIVGSTIDQLQRKLLKLVEAQYGTKAAELYPLLEKARKVLLLDDLDVPGAHPDTLGRALEFIQTHFDYAVITVGDTFDIAELSSSKTSEASKAFKHFKLTGFGFELRSELIKRWVKLGGAQTNFDYQHKVHDAQQVIDTVIGKGLVPTTAFNVLVILQTIEAGQRATLANAGLAQYYEYLVRQGLLDAKVKSDELDEIFNYLAGLAWRFSEEQGRPLDQSDLQFFNDEFSRTVHKTDLQPRLELLVKAKILKKVGVSFAFRYPYIRFFFKARYIASQLEDHEDFKAHVKHACQHLYLKENANTILFLSHHVASKWIVREVAMVLNRLLTDIVPVDIAGDTSTLNKWVSSTAKIAVDATDLEKNRRQERRHADRAAEIIEREHDQELTSISDLDQIAQVNLLFKTSEILGQILKNKYGSLDKTLKGELLKELFDGPLRAINLFLQILNENPEALINILSEKFREKLPNMTAEEADRNAQRLIFLSVGNIADNFIARQGDIIGSPKLKDDIHALIGKNDTYKLVGIAAQLSYPNQIPFAEIEALSEKFKTNIFGFRLLQGLAARHLYMFYVPFEERQRLAHITKIDVQTNRQIEIRSSGSKKIPKRAGYQPRNSKSLILRLQSSFLRRLKSEKDSKQ